MQKIYLFIVLTFFIFSQNSSGFSSGDTKNWIKSNSAPSLVLGRGTSGFGENNKNRLNFLNSSTWYNSSRTLFDFNILSSRNSVNLDNNTSSLWGTQLGTLAWVSSVVDSSLAIGFTLKTLYENSSRTSLAIFQEKDGVSTEIGNKLYENTGNINEIKAGLSSGLTKDISIGLDLLYYQGNFSIDEKQEFNSASDLTESKKLYEKYTTYNGMSLGLNFSTRLQNDKLSLSGGYSFEKKLTAEAKKSFQSGTSSSLDTEEIITATDFVVPERFTFGAHYKSNGGHYFADFQLEGETSVSNSSNFISLGYQTNPSKQVFESFLKRSTYTFGAYYYNENFKVNDNEIINYGISVGMSLPFNYNLNSLSLGLSYGKRGDESKNGLSESVLKFSIGISIGEFWYISPEDN